MPAVLAHLAPSEPRAEVEGAHLIKAGVALCRCLAPATSSSTAAGPCPLQLKVRVDTSEREEADVAFGQVISAAWAA